MVAPVALAGWVDLVAQASTALPELETTAA